ncbi:putative membrane protein [Amycolatopsis lexingtonensis]|uniref:Membrane protein n=1 Tax=Amycolatopsis lexingtonensis TaxID=218822 RepID=A0ABR9HSL8_9PSEU|nr:hypothetical protein [Amycolatopsis lexingtonensis]MBE1493925.1 putative membrane protein [Amycolatopsis lexingtonensis]
MATRSARLLPLCAFVALGLVSVSDPPVAQAAQAPTYTAVDLGPLSAGERTDAHAANDAGVIVGESGTRPVRWNRAGGVTALPTLAGYPDGGAVDVNESGEIAGYVSQSSAARPVRWDRAGHVQALALPGDAASGYTVSINARGSVLGSFIRPDYRWRSVRWDPAGRPVELAALAAGGDTTAYSMNDRDEVVGIAADETGVQFAVRWDRAGRISKLPAPNTATGPAIDNRGDILDGMVVWDRWGQVTNLSTEPDLGSPHTATINDHGLVVGWAWTADGEQKCVRWDRAGQATVLNPLPPDTTSSCSDIDDRGTVVGYSFAEGTMRPAYWDTRAHPLPSPAGLRAWEAQHITGTGGIILGLGYDPGQATFRGIAWQRR